MLLRFFIKNMAVLTFGNKYCHDLPFQIALSSSHHISFYLKGN